MDDGLYQENAPLFNQIHEAVTRALRNHYNRSLGFFLKSDRHYPKKDKFDHADIFRFDQKLKRDHIWGVAFSTSDVQYNDMYDFLVQQRYHYLRGLGQYHDSKRRGAPVATTEPLDPLADYDRLLQRLFAKYALTDGGQDVPKDLFVQLPGGPIVPFTDLSSGEKEVFFILSFFLRHEVSNAVIVVDEPELHLHPELARTLVRTMRSIRPGNQIWLASHNPEIVDETGPDRVHYISRNVDGLAATVTRGIDEPAALQSLRDLFGYSGYIGVAKSMVFLEGEGASADRKLFSALFALNNASVKLIPSQTSSNLPRINTAILAIIESSLGWLQFYLIRDRDYLLDDAVAKYSQHASGRLHILSRYHIENYLLQDELIAKAQTDILGRPIAPSMVAARLRQAAVRISGEVLRDMVCSRVSQVYSPEDLGVGSILVGQAIADSEEHQQQTRVSLLRDRVLAGVERVNARITTESALHNIDHHITECLQVVTEALAPGSEGWRKRFPGRRLLEAYASDQGLGRAVVLQNAVIKELASDPTMMDPELLRVVSTVQSGDSFRVHRQNAS
jgi:hypothetical protein